MLPEKGVPSLRVLCSCLLVLAGKNASPPAAVEHGIRVGDSDIVLVGVAVSWENRDAYYVALTDAVAKGSCESGHYMFHSASCKKGRGSPYSITECRVSELILVLGSQPAGDVSHKPSGRLPLLSARPAVTPATLKRAATNFAAW